MTDLNKKTGLTSLLIASPVNDTNGSVDSNPGPTIVNGQPVSAVLELRSTEGALLISRMTTAERDDLNPDDGMILYNRETNAFNLRVNGEWVPLVSIIADGVENDIVVFGDTPGSLKDSGVTIADFFPQSVQNVNELFVPGNNIAISDLSYLQFKSGSGYLFIGEDPVLNLYVQPPSEDPIQPVCLVIADGGSPPSPTSTSCALEVNTRFGALLLSRMPQTTDDIGPGVDQLVNTRDGMMLLNSTSRTIQARRGGNSAGVGGAWSNVSTNPQNIKTIDVDYQILETDDFISVETSTISPIMPILVLPLDPKTGQTYTIYDGKGNADVSNIFANGNGRSINGEGEAQEDVVMELIAVSNPNIMNINPSGNRGFVSSDYPDTAFVYFQDVSDGGAPGFQAVIGLNGGNSPRCMAFSSNGLYGYIGNLVVSTPTLARFNNATSGAPAVTQLNTLNGVSNNMAITQNGNIYITTEADTIDLYSAADSGTPVNESFFPGIVGAFGVAITPDQNYAYITTSAGVTVIGNASYSGGNRPAVIATIPLDSDGAGCSSVAITPDGSYAYISCKLGCEKIFVIKNVQSGSPENDPDKTFEIDSSYGLAVTPDGKYLYISNATNVIDNQGLLTVMHSASTGIPIKLFDIACQYSSMGGVSITPSGSYAYVCHVDSISSPFHVTKIMNASTNKVLIIDDQYDGSQLIFNGNSWNAFHMPSKPGSA